MNSQTCPKKCKERPECCKKACCLPSRMKPKFFSITYVEHFRKRFINIKKAHSNIYVSKILFKLKNFYIKNKIYLAVSMIITACILFILHYTEEDEKLADQFQIAASVVVAIAYVGVYFGTYDGKEIRKLIASAFRMLGSGIGFTLIIYLLEPKIKNSLEIPILVILCFFSTFLLIMWFLDLSKTIKAFLWGNDVHLHKKFLNGIIAFISTLGTIAGTITILQNLFLGSSK